MRPTPEIALAASAEPKPSRRPRAGANPGDRAWGAALVAVGCAVLLLAGLIVYTLLHASQPLWQTTRVDQFLRSSDWDPVNDAFGALPFIYGTLVTSLLAKAPLSHPLESPITHHHLTTSKFLGVKTVP